MTFPSPSRGLRTAAAWAHRTLSSRRVALALVIGFAMAGAAVASTALRAPGGSSFGDPEPPAEIQRLMAGVFSPDRCVRAAEAERSIRARLVESGYTGWSVTWGTGVGSDSCVGSSANALHDSIVLTLALHPEVRRALSAVADDLLTKCLTKDEAADLVRSVLVDTGEENWELRTDGPIVAPNDRIEEVERHVEAGCWIYAGTGWTEDGKRMFFIGGE